MGQQNVHPKPAERHQPSLEGSEGNLSADLLEVCEAALRELESRIDDLTPRRIQAILRRNPKPGGGLFTRDQLLRAYRDLCDAGKMTFDPRMARHLRRKPTRTISGVAPVTVLTAPHPCRGHCVYCPDVPEAPKSYLPDEPGVQRAIRFDYDPYAQTAGRIRAFENIGHPTDKVELLILGGSWSDYPPDYQEWFVRRCFDALNGAESGSLEQAQQRNETAPHRSVGLSIETRPDCISLGETLRLRRLGVTKVQLGAQSLDDDILALNRRGHTTAETRQAVRQLRLAGFKIVLHWMPNLLGATPESDLEDFDRLWRDPALRPDELKIYPCLLLKGTELYDLWRKGDYQPYDTRTLIELLAACKTRIPPYCRVNRLMRDIPAPDIAAGITKSNLRQIVQNHMSEKGMVCRCIRCREVREEMVSPEALRLSTTIYKGDGSEERFLAYETPQGHLVGFLRLSLPQAMTEIEELQGCALIRELHVYGPALALGDRSEGRPQHAGLGTRLLDKAQETARQAGYGRLAVIAAIGTRPYYLERGFELQRLYMVKKISP